MNPSTCTIAFTPALGFVGAVPSFAYEVKDAAGLTSAPATVSITVIKPATPAAADISATTPVNTLISLTPTPPSGAGPFIFSIVSGPAGGAATINPTTGAITYAPATDVSGVDHLSYRVTDQYGQASPAATATITVMPLAQAAATAGVQGSPLTITMPAPTGTGPFTCALVPSSLPPATEGTVTMTGCTATFTPAATYSGTLAVQYRVTDAAGVASASQPITFAVSAHNTTSAAGSPPHLANAADPSGLANPALVATGLLLLVVAAIAAWRRRREDRDGAR